MKTHILFIDPLEKLEIKKDSTLMLAIALKMLGKKVYLLFENDFVFDNTKAPEFELYDFEGEFTHEDVTIDSFKLTTKTLHILDVSYCLHMRIDPPFDSRYLRYLWLLDHLNREYKIQIMNSAFGVMRFNEKLLAYEHNSSVASYVGQGEKRFLEFCEYLKKKNNEFIVLKPLDLYQGIGVEKISLNITEKSLVEIFNKKVNDYHGPVVAQPFLEEIKQGEVRAIYFKGKELGSIIKVPAKGEFLSNIARGATYSSYSLTKKQKELCDEFADNLAKCGVDWIAYDILGDAIQEVNITCPGLLVEVSKAVGKNLASIIAEQLE